MLTSGVPSGSTCSVLFTFSFVGGDYCTNTVIYFYHTLIVFVVHFAVLYLILGKKKTNPGAGLPVSRELPAA